MSHGAVDWAEESPSLAPTHRVYTAMTYASAPDRVVLFSGIVAFGTSPATDTWDNETWTYDLNTNTWDRVNPVPTPPGRGGHAMAYDAGSDRIVLFGGVTLAPLNLFVDTWAYDVGANRWTNMSPASHPPSMLGARMVYDVQSDRIILFGGLYYPDLTFYDRTWAYDFETNTWTEMNPSTRPQGRDYHGMAYDVESDRVILFGGCRTTGCASFGDTWAYDFNGNVWTNMQPTSAPSARSYVDMVYDVESDQAILFGGTSGANETWAYDFNSNTWSNMNSPAPPAGRSRHALAYDSESNRTILFSGCAGCPPFDTDQLMSETWSYDYVVNHPGAPRNLMALAGEAEVALSWQPPLADGGSPITGYRVHRGTSSGSLGVLADLADETSYNDTSAAGGVTYFYRVSAVTAAGEGPLSDEVSATPSSPPDTTIPTIVITTPSEGAILETAAVEVKGTASDNVGVDTVELSLDGDSWVLATGTDEWSGSLSLSEGPNLIRARATDSSGNAATRSVNVTLVPPGPDLTPVFIGIGAGAAAIAGGVFWMWRRQRR